MKCALCHKEVDIGDKVYFRDECLHCSGDLHICLNCEFHDPHASKECREPSAELVSNKDRANYCDYFRSGEGNKASNNAADAKKQLDALFKK